MARAFGREFSALFHLDTCCRAFAAGILIVIVASCTIPGAWAQESVDQVYRTFAYKCDFSTMTHPDVARCLADAVKRMKIKLASELNRALAAADGAAADGDISGKSGAEIARQERSDIVKAQKAWQAYSDAECAKIENVIFLGGGNGSDVAGAECELRHMAQRITELR